MRTAVQTTKTIPFYFVWGMICPLDSGHLCEWESPNHTLAKMSPLPFNANDLHITCDFPSLLEHLYDWLNIFPRMLFPQDRPVWFTFVVRGVCLAARLEICSDVTCIPEWEILVSRLFFHLVERFWKALDVNSIFGLPADYLYNVQLKIIKYSWLYRWSFKQIGWRSLSLDFSFYSVL